MPPSTIAVDDAGRAGDEGRELPVGAAGRVPLQPLAGREHDADDRRSQRLSQQERADDGQHGDEVDAGLAMQQVADDRERQPDADDDGGDRPAPRGRLLVAEPREHEAEDEAADGERQQET